MSIPAWPATLPLPNLSGFKVKRRNVVARTDMEAGLARHRRRAVGKIYDFTAVWRFTPAQKVLFDSFFEDDIYSGVGWFTISLTTNGTMSPFTARFIPDSVDDSALSGMNWEVSAKMEAVRA